MVAPASIAFIAAPQAAQSGLPVNAAMDSEALALGESLADA